MWTFVAHSVEENLYNALITQVESCLNHTPGLLSSFANEFQAAGPATEKACMMAVVDSEVRYDDELISVSGTKTDEK